MLRPPTSKQKPVLTESDWPHVLVLCHGNICRSPLAAAVIRRYGLAVRDRGLSDKQGRRAAKKVRDYAAKRGYDLSNHRSQTVSVNDIHWAHVILYMDGGNRTRLAGTALQKAVCLAEYVGELRIPDPNYIPRGPELDRLLRMVVQAAEAFATRYQRKTPVVSRGSRA